ncbi:hypothetical protein [Nonomuraea rhizosphaerae]|nr:hypothetical protein [Nonomuraea rhizosphaerae]
MGSFSNGGPAPARSCRSRAVIDHRVARGHGAEGLSGLVEELRRAGG